MLLVDNVEVPSILAPDFGPAAEVINPEGRVPILLVCEHASAAIPVSLADLGLSDDDRYSHAVWDVGAEALARKLSALLDAPLILSRVSRLVYDCNRPPEAADAIPSQSDQIAVPGNRYLSESDRAARFADVYVPLHDLIAQTLASQEASQAFVTIHSFSPVWNDVPRATEIGLLHDRDTRLASAMLAASDQSVNVEMNQPYSAADGVTHTLAIHATQQALENVMIEVRSDLIGDRTGQSRIADAIAAMLMTAIVEGADAA